MKTTRRHTLSLFAGALAAGVLASCDTPTRPPTEGSIAPRIALIQPDSATRASLVLPLTAVRATVIGPTGKVIDLTLQGSTWTGRARGLAAGTYELVIEGLANGEVQFYGRTTGINVVRGEETAPPVPFAAAVPVVAAPPLSNTTNFTQRIPFARVAAATGYAMQVSQSPTFSSGNIEFATTDTNPLITVNNVGTWYVRTRATLPSTSSTVPWSDSRSWVVTVASGGNNPSTATPVAIVPGGAQTVAERNLTPGKREDWFDVAVRAGDSVFVETFAARLALPSALNTILTLFRADAPTTQIATNDDFAATVDSRIVVIAPNTETAKIRVSAVGSTSGHYELAIQLKRLPAAPTALQRTVVSGTRVDLTWTDNSDNETAFAIERCLGATCTNFAEIGTVAANAVTYQDAALAQDQTYRWQVRARNAVGNSAYTAIVTANTFGPAVPSALTATTIGENRIDLAWLDNAGNETGFLLERCTGVACTVFSQIAAPAENAQAYSDVGVVFGQSYTYRIRATNNVATSVPSASASASTFPPATPTALVATVMGATRIDLAWTDNANNEQGFYIERCLGDACTNFAQIGTVGANVQSYQDVGVVYNNGYRYRVRAFHVVTGVAYTNVANADTRPPVAPTVLTATTTSGTSIDLAWTDNSDDELGFIIERCTGGACTNFAAVDTVAGGVTAVADATVALNNTYRYRVSAIGVPGNSVASNIATANTLVPVNPTGTTATTVSATRIDVAWVDNATNEAGYLVQRCNGPSCVGFFDLATLAAGSASHQDLTVAAGQSYSYRVRAFNVAGASAFDAVATANTFAPAAPSAFTATTVGATQVDLAWTNNAPEAVSMRIERCDTPGCTNFVEINAVAAAQTTFSDNSVTVNNTYTYRIRAQNLAGVSGYVAAPAVNTNLPGAPTAFNAVTASGTQIQLSWGPASGTGITSFTIERCLGTGCTIFSTVNAVSGSTFVYNDVGVSAGNDYRYRIRATNVVGAGAYSVTLAANTRGPDAPTGLGATAMTGKVRLTWADNADNEDQLLVERCVGDGCVGFVQITAVGNSNLVQWDDTTVTANNSYSYQIRVANVIGFSNYSNTASTNTNLAAVPSGLGATTITATRIDLAWTDNAVTETGFVIERCTADGCVNFAPLTTVGANATTYADLGLSPEQSYTYRVRASAPFGNSDPSNAVTATTRVPVAPTMTGVATLSNTSIEVTWGDNSDNEAAFDIERCAGAGCLDFGVVGSAAANATSFVSSFLAPNETYRFRVRAINAAGASAYSGLAEATTNFPATPSALSAVIVNATALNLNWTDNATDELGFEVESCAGGGCSGFATLATVGANLATYAVNGLTNGATYRFRVRAFNAAGESDYSNIVSVTVGIPATPTGLTATTINVGRIELAWTDASDNEGSFVIQRCAGVTCGGGDFAMLTGVPANTTTFNDNTVAASTTYRYRILAENAAGPSPYSNEDDASTNLPDAPTGLVATTISSTQVDLSWTDGGPYEVSTQIERCTGLGCVNFSVVATVPVNVVIYQNSGLDAGLFYRYRVRSINAVGQSSYSNIAEAETNLPADPTALTAVAVSATVINLAWTDNATNETDYTVERCDGAGCGGVSFLPIDVIGANANAYSDATVAPDSWYSYRVVAANTSGASAYSNVATTNTFAPSAPTALTATTVSGGQVDLSWTENANNELSLDLERCAGESCSSFAVIVTLPPNSNAYEDFGVTPGVSYTYRTRAINNVAASAYTNVATANTYLPAAPTGITATTIASDQVNISWNDNANNEQGYQVERCVGASCSDFTLWSVVGAGTELFQDTGLNPSESYSYRVRAYNLSGVSAFDGPVTATTLVPAAPTSLVATVISASQIDLTWTDNTDNELGYRIERCSGVGCSNFVEVTTVGANQTSASIGGHSISQRYKYRVRAHNAAGVSSYSNIADATTFLPSAPTALSAVTVLANRIDLSWTEAAVNENGFKIERCYGAACAGFAEIVQVGANVTTYSDLTVTPGEQVRYRVRSYNGVGNSAYSNIAEDNSTVPVAPSAMVALPSGQTVMFTQWSDNSSDEAGFSLERCAGVGCVNFAEIKQTAANVASYNDTTVVPNTAYRYRVRAFGNGSSDYSNIGEGTTILPAIPSGLVAVAVSDSRIDLTWTDNADNENVYRVLRCVGGSCTDFGQIANLGADATSYSDLTAVQNTTYRYAVEASNGAGNSGISNVAMAVTNVPGIPTALTATTVTAIRVDLAWTDNANNETGFYIERCTGAGCTNFAVTDSVPANVGVHFDSTLAVSTSYRYRVRAFNATGSSGYSNIASAATNPPTAPSDLVATTMSPTQIDLSWTDNADNEAQYQIQRCDGTGCSDFDAPVVLGADAISYSDATIVVDSIYTYRVRAVNAAGVSAYAAAATANTFRPAAPSGLAAMTVSATQINLSWTDNASNETLVRIERCTGPACSNFAEIATVGVNVTSYQDPTLSASQSYTYRIRASNIAGSSNYSGVATATTNFPLAPTALTALTVSDVLINLGWADNADNETGFEVQRCTGVGCSTFAFLTSAGVDVTTLGDNTVSLGSSYSYRVRSVNAAGASAYSNEVTATTFVPGDPTISTGTAMDPVTARIDWALVPTASGYKLERCTVGSCVYSEIADVADPTTENFDAVTTTETYQYRMRAYNAAGASGYSNVMTVSMNPPAAAGGLTVVATSSTGTELVWDDNSDNEQGFRVERCAGAGCVAFSEIVIVAAGETSYVDAGLTEGAIYVYRIVANNAVGNGVPSNQFTVSLNAPAAPSGLVATTTGLGQIDLTWTDNAIDETSFSIERCGGAGCGGFVQIATVGVNVGSYQDTGLGLNVVWRYRVRALNNIGPSAYSNEDQANTLVPAAASDLATVTFHGERIDLSWTDNSPNNSGFRVERCLGAGCSGFASVGVVGPNQTTYIDNGTVAFGQEYNYRVVAFNISGDGTPSNVAAGSTVLAAPSNLVAKTTGRQNINVTWAHSSTFETGFQVEACVGVACAPTTLVGTPGANVLTFPHGSLPVGADISYRVRAVTVGGASGYSNIASSRTPVVLASGVPITGLADGSGGERHFVLNVPSGALGLRVRQSGGSGDPDLYVKRGAVPIANQVLNDADNCVPYIGGTLETCTFTNPTPGDWFTMVQGFSPYTGTQVKMSIAERFGQAADFGVGTGMPADYIVAQPLTLSQPMEVTHIGALISGGVATNVKFALYNNRVGVGGNEPNQLLTQISSVFNPGLNEVAISEITIPAGVYWFAILPQVQITPSYNVAIPVLWKYLYSVNGVSYAGGFPATWPLVFNSTSYYNMSFFGRGFR